MKDRQRKVQDGEDDCSSRFASFVRLKWRRINLRRLHRNTSGATSTEYMLIMIFIVLPIALMMPRIMGMVKTYGGRMTSLMGLPFP